MLEEKPKEAYAVETVYAYVTRDPQGDEGLVTIINPMGQMQPLIAFEEKQLGPMGQIAQQIADETKKDVKLLKFSTREELDTFEPKVVKLAQPSDMPKG